VVKKKMKNLIHLMPLVLLANCSSISKEDFKETYQREICDKYSLYANSKDLAGSLSLYADNAVVNGNAVEPIVGIEAIKGNFLEWHGSTKKINHSATVISAKGLVIRHSPLVRRGVVGENVWCRRYNSPYSSVYRSLRVFRV